MAGGTIRRKLIHRESFRASVLHHSENHAVLHSIAANRCPLTTPSLLSRATRRLSYNHARQPPPQAGGASFQLQVFLPSTSKRGRTIPHHKLFADSTRP